MPNKVDTTRTDYKYWDDLLTKMGYGMNRGLKPFHGGSGKRHRGGRGRRNGHMDSSDIQYVGDVQDLETYVLIATSDRRLVRPSGHGPDY